MNDTFTSKKLKKKYDNYYTGKSEWRKLGAYDKAANIVILSNGIYHNKVLDIGSGEGAVLDRLHEIGFSENLYSFEISKSAVDAIKSRKIPSLKECLLYDGYRIPIKDKSFDLCILSHVIEHTEHPRMILREAGRVAKYVFIEVPLELTTSLPINHGSPYKEIGHINYYSLKTIRHLIQTSELEVLSQKIINPSYRLYKYQFRQKAFIRYAIKKSALLLWPNLATKIFTYNSALLCRTIK